MYDGWQLTSSPFLGIYVVELGVRHAVTVAAGLLVLDACSMVAALAYGGWP